MADLELQNLTKRFGHFPAVDDLSLKVEKGEFISLLGPSGCGKTTTLRMIAGLIKPDRGEIYIKNERVNDTPVYKRNLGMIFQSYALFPHLTVADNIGFGLKMKGYRKAEIIRKTQEVLELIQLPDIGNRFPRQLSGGQQQRVALARAIVTEPALLLLDEPLSNLDAKLRERMRIEIKQLQAKLHITTIYVTHDQTEALTMSDRVVVMHQGRIEQIGSPAEVYETPATGFVASFIGRSNFLRGTVIRKDEEEAEVSTRKGLRIRTYPSPELSTGQEVTLAIRPERIRLLETREARSLPNGCAGTIEFIAYLGASTQYQIISEQGEWLIVEQQNIRGLPAKKKGDRVYLEWNPEDCLFSEFPEETS